MISLNDLIWGKDEMNLIVAFDDSSLNACCGGGSGPGSGGPGSDEPTHNR